MPIDPLTTAVSAWAWDKYGKSLADKAAGALKGRWDRFKWKDAAEAYRSKVKRLYGTMKIMGMAGPVPLENIFTDVYMLDRPMALARFDIERLRQLSADPDAPPPDAKRINGLRLVREKDNLFILGKPGAGKTTFLKYTAIKAAEQLIDKIPIFVSLKEWSDSGLALMPFIAERFDTCDFPAAQPFVEELLRSGNAIVLFDGLDEVSQEVGRRDEQVRAMNNFVEKYDRAQCLITCRVAASDYSFEHFDYVELADFTRRQIEQFVGNWFRNQEGERDEETCKLFLAELDKGDNEGLRELARTPLLLTWLCLSFSETLTFPQRRAEFYKEVLDALLKKWDLSKSVRRDEVYNRLSLEHKENMLARIAAETFEKNEYFIPQEKLERLITDYVRNVLPHGAEEAIDGEAVLKAIEAQHGILVERAHGVYSFAHLTFQEYFTARYIVANAAKGTLTNLVRGYCWDVRWREVFLLTASMLPDASQFMLTFRHAVDELLGGNQMLAALLEWAARKAASMDGDPWLVRPTYLYDGLSHETNNTLLQRLIESALIRAQSFSHNRVLDIVLSGNLAAALKHDPDLKFSDALSFVRSFGLDELERGLATLSIPSSEATDAEWRQLVARLRALMIRHRDTGYEWNLTEEQEMRLVVYLIANSLLQDCLELAFVPPDEKKSILNSLYLPPAHG